jgi:hypothetical protein
MVADRFIDVAAFACASCHRGPGRVPRLKARCGAGLAEMIVALTLSAVVSAAAAAALTSTERYVRRSRSTSEARRTVREAAAVLASELRAASSDSVRTRGDTAVDFQGMIGVSVICVSSGTVLVLPPEVAASGVPYSTWRAAPEAGDVVSVFDTTGGGAWRTSIVDSSSSPSNGAGCKPSSGLMSQADSAARRPVTRVVLRSSLPAAVATVGAPVRVSRPGRYALTRAADGSWSLSYRRCTGSCGVAQPVAGPFAAPSDSGIVFASVAGVSSIQVALRAYSSDTAAPRVSDTLRVTLRNRALGAP